MGIRLLLLIGVVLCHTFTLNTTLQAVTPGSGRYRSTFGHGGRIRY